VVCNERVKDCGEEPQKIKERPSLFEGLSFFLGGQKG